MTLGAAAAVSLTAVPCCFSCLLFRHVEGRSRATPAWLIQGAEASLWLVAPAIAFACLTVGLVAFRHLLTRRASAPLPPPAADPLASYREGPTVECPRHPFAAPTRSPSEIR